MFAHHCRTCARRVLVFPSQVLAVTNTDRGIVVTFTCWCETRQVLVTGDRAPAPRHLRAVA